MTGTRHPRLSAARCPARLGLECRRCQQACPRLAISIASGQEPELDRRACDGCGLCVAACPQGAWSLPWLVTARVVKQLAPLAGRKLELRCRDLARERGSSHRLVRLPCVAAAHPALLVTLRLLGASSVELVGGCPTCREQTGRLLLGENLGVARIWLRLLGVPPRLLQRRAKPGRLDRRGLSRRLLLRATERGLDLLTAGTGGEEKEATGIGWRRALALLLEEIPLHDARRLTRRGWLSLGKVSCDAAACHLCGACARACPTGAIEMQNGEPSRLLHLPRHCSGCAICQRVCPTGALESLPVFSTAALLESRPRLLVERALPACRRCARPGGLRNGLCPSCFRRLGLERLPDRRSPGAGNRDTNPSEVRPW